MSIDRTKYMDAREVETLRASTEAWAIIDDAHGRIPGVLTWMAVDLLLMTGLRVSEVIRLTHGDVDYGRSLLTVWRHKRRPPVQESLAIPESLMRHIRQFGGWKVARRGQPTGPGDIILVGERGPLSVRGVFHLWSNAIRRAGLPEDYIGPHTARHTLAVHLQRQTKNIRLVQKQLGHTSIQVTSNFYADVAHDEMLEAVNGVYTNGDARKPRKAPKTRTRQTHPAQTLHGEARAADNVADPPQRAERADA